MMDNMAVARVVECPRGSHRMMLRERVPGELMTPGLCMACGFQGDMPVPQDSDRP